MAILRITDLYAQISALDIASDFNQEWKNEDYYNYNFDKAKELMAEAGYPDGGFTVPPDVPEQHRGNFGFNSCPGLSVQTGNYRGIDAI